MTSWRPGASFEAACAKAGIRPKTAREHLRSPAVRACYQERLSTEAMIERICALHTLAELRDNAQSEKVRLEAAKTLYKAEDEARQGLAAAHPVPGYVIVLQPPSTEPSR